MNRKTRWKIEESENSSRRKHVDLNIIHTFHGQVKVAQLVQLLHWIVQNSSAYPV